MASSIDPYHVPGPPLHGYLKLNPQGSLKDAKPRWVSGPMNCLRPAETTCTRVEPVARLCEQTLVGEHSGAYPTCTNSSQKPLLHGCSTAPVCTFTAESCPMEPTPFSLCNVPYLKLSLLTLVGVFPRTERGLGDQLEASYRHTAGKENKQQRQRNSQSEVQGPCYIVASDSHPLLRSEEVLDG